MKATHYPGHGHDEEGPAGLLHRPSPRQGRTAGDEEHGEQVRASSPGLVI